MSYMTVKYDFGTSYRDVPGPQILVHREGMRCGGIVDGPHYQPVDTLIVNHLNWRLGYVWPCQICCKHLWTPQMREQFREVS